VASAFWHTQVILTAKSGLARDNVINTFNFATDTVEASEVDAQVGPALVAFYNTTESGLSHPLAYWLSAHISRTANACEIKYYDVHGHLDGSAVGSPAATRFFTLGAVDTNAGGLPAEVACCLSMHADLSGLLEHVGTTRPKARHRGRVYIGPFVADTGSIIVDDSNGQSRPQASIYSTILKAGDALRQMTHAGSPSVNAQLAVWSKKDAAMHQVVGVSVDDAWDVQRRRGPRPATTYKLP
jgi:hypothetical protein